MTDAPNKFTHLLRLGNCETVANAALAEARRAHQRLDIEAKRSGEKGATGEKGESIKGDKGERGDAGPQGPAGVSIKGDRGEKGATGAPSTIPGPAGATGPRGLQGERGLTGPKGDKGDAGPAPDLSKLEAVLVHFQQLQSQVAGLQFTVLALLDANKKGQEYIEFLRAKIAAAKGKQ